ncbi:MAG: putative methyltransferase [Caldiserica bacterium]|nr:MAG: putative methyltransferase [Caldisericota bacterium]
MEIVKEEIIRFLSRGGKDFWSIVSFSNYSAKEVIDAIGTLIKDGIIEERNEKFYVKNPLPEIVSTSYRCSECKGRGVVDEKDRWRELLNEYNNIAKERPRPTTLYDQGVVDSDTALARMLYMLERGDIYKKKILILGDDDLMGILFALSKLPEEIVVLEVDERLVNFIDRISKEKGLSNLKAIRYDARWEIPEELKGKFDVFFTDPVETVKGIELFISRLLEGVKGVGSSGYFGLTTIESDMKKWLAIEKSLLEMNLVITDVVRKFSWYSLGEGDILESDLPIIKENPFKLGNPKTLWYNSHLFRVELVGEKVIKIKGEVDWGRDLYFDEYTYVVNP